MNNGTPVLDMPTLESWLADGWMPILKRRASGQIYPAVSIQRSGLIGLNVTARRIVGDAVKLYYNVKRHAVAIVPTEKGTPDSYDIGGNSSAGQITCRKAWRQMGLDPTELKGMYYPTLENGALVVALPPEEAAKP